MMNNLWTEITNSLPKYPTDGKKFFATGYEILSKDETAINTLAELFEAMEFSDVMTGYYDPAEDERNEETDELTGYYCVSID
jgi:hypothetical protein